MPSRRLVTSALLALAATSAEARTRGADPGACLAPSLRAPKAEIVQVAKGCRAYLSAARPDDPMRDAVELKAGESLLALGRTEAALGHFDAIANRAGAMASTGRAPPSRGTPSAEAIQGVLLSARLRAADVRRSHEVPDVPAPRRLEEKASEPPSDILPWLGLIEWGLRETAGKPALRAEFVALDLRA